MVWSSSDRKLSANWILRALKSLIAAISALVRFVGLWSGLLGEAVSDEGSSGFGCNRSFRGDLSGFCGEYWSFQSLMASAVQKASRLGRNGGVGIRGTFFEGDCNFDFEGEAGGGGVAGRSMAVVLCGLRCCGGEIRI